MTTDNEPISRLDQRIEALLRALARTPNLADLVAVMRIHEQMVDQMGPEFPGVVDALVAAEFRRALIDVMDEVLVLQGKGADHGHKD